MSYGRPLLTSDVMDLYAPPPTWRDSRSRTIPHPRSPSRLQRKEARAGPRREASARPRLVGGTLDWIAAKLGIPCCDVGKKPQVAPSPESDESQVRQQPQPPKSDKRRMVEMPLVCSINPSQHVVMMRSSVLWLMLASVLTFLGIRSSGVEKKIAQWRWITDPRQTFRTKRARALRARRTWHACGHGQPDDPDTDCGRGGVPR
jgi:hypothetical protein